MIARTPGLEYVAARLRAAGCVFAEDEAAILLEAAPEDPGRLEWLIRAREQGEPLEQLVGWVAFCGLRLEVGPGVFVPRVRTELLAEESLARLPRRAVVLELCCGVAAVAAVIARSAEVAELYAADIDPRATRIARRNLDGRATVLTGDLYDPLPPVLRGRVDLIAANAPYVPTGKIAFMPREARDHEPAVALDGGPDGADVHRQIVGGVRGWLAPAGWLLIETGREQSAITTSAMTAAGLDVEVITDDERAATVVAGRRR